MSLKDGSRLIAVPRSDAVDARSVDQLVSAARTLAATVTASGIGGTERLARAARAADAARDLHDITQNLDPYADRRHSRVADLAALDTRRRHVTDAQRADAIERLNRAQAHERLTHELRAVAWVDATGLKSGVPLPVPDPSGPFPSVAAFLDAYAVAPDVPLGPGRWLAGAWEDVPPAAIDPPTGTEVGGATPSTLPGGLTSWHTSAYVLDVSEQVEDWTVGGANEIENLLRLIVDTGLEKVILSDLTAGAPAAADIPAALAACTWPTGADLVLVAGGDAPGVNASFGAAGQWPPPVRVLATAGQAPGTATVLASGGVIVEADDGEFLTQTKPALLGQDIAFLRYGLGRARMPGAVVTVDLTAGVGP